jgi:hypothetical protein
MFFLRIVIKPKTVVISQIRSNEIKPSILIIPPVEKNAM